MKLTNKCIASFPDALTKKKNKFKELYDVGDSRVFVSLFPHYSN